MPSEACRCTGRVTHRRGASRAGLDGAGAGANMSEAHRPLFVRLVSRRKIRFFSLSPPEALARRTLASAHLRHVRTRVSTRAPCSTHARRPHSGSSAARMHAARPHVRTSRATPLPRPGPFCTAGRLNRPTGRLEPEAPPERHRRGGQSRGQQPGCGADLRITRRRIRTARQPHPRAHLSRPMQPHPSAATGGWPRRRLARTSRAVTRDVTRHGDVTSPLRAPHARR